MYTIRLFAMLAILLLAACESTVYLPGPSDPRPIGGYSHTALWQTATGSAPNRMELAGAEDPLADVAHATLYRTLWQSPITQGETWLVCLQHPGQSLGGIDQWSLFVYDQNHRMVLHGEVHTNGTAIPVGIIEVNAVGDRIPGNSLTGEWWLAVVSCNVATGDYNLHGKPLWGEDHGLGLVASLVHWENAFEELPYGYGNLIPRHLESIAFRQAEAGLAVKQDRRLVFDSARLSDKPEPWLDFEE